jgi:cytochrome d ubiquinol oxidase subunit II
VSLADSLAALMFLSLMAYGLLAGADFGAGFWDLVAGDARRGARQRSFIARSIGPVWEANHVWLIFALVLLWTVFPSAFAAIASTLYVPLSLVAVGVILRGSAFAFRKEVHELGERQLFGAIFALSSVVTPFFLGTIAGAIASGRVPDEGPGDIWGSWWNATGVLGGTLAVVVCAFLAAVYLAADAARAGEADLVAGFRRRALGAAVVAGAVALAGILVLREDAPTLYDGLTSGADLVLIPLSAAAGLATIVLLARGRFDAARLAAAVAVVAVLAGWGVAQYPDIVVGELTIEQAAGARASLVAVWVSVALGMVVLVPSLAYLFALLRRGDLTAPAQPRGPSAAAERRPPSAGARPAGE